MISTLVSDVMTPTPVTFDAGTPVSQAAKAMRDTHVGDVVVLDAGSLCGVVTDRDIVVRAIAEDRDPRSTPLGDVCSEELTVVAPSTPVEEATELMRTKAIRRLPVLDDGRVVGIVSLGDLAVSRDPESVLADVSAAPPNR